MGKIWQNFRGPFEMASLVDNVGPARATVAQASEKDFLDSYADWSEISKFNEATGSTVFSATDRKTQTQVAIKKIERSAQVSVKWEARLRSEIETHRASSRGEHVATSLDSVEVSSDVFYVVMELCQGVQLFDLVAKRQRLNEPPM